MSKADYRGDAKPFPKGFRFVGSTSEEKSKTALGRREGKGKL